MYGFQNVVWNLPFSTT